MLPSLVGLASAFLDFGNLLTVYPTLKLRLEAKASCYKVTMSLSRCELAFTASTAIIGRTGSKYLSSGYPVKQWLQRLIHRYGMYTEIDQFTRRLEAQQ